MTTTNTIGTTKTDENTHPFAGPEFVVFPHAKREKIRQALLDAHQVYHLQQMLGADVRDHALGAVTTKRTLCVCESARRVASNALIS